MNSSTFETWFVYGMIRFVFVVRLTEDFHSLFSVQFAGLKFILKHTGGVLKGKSSQVKALHRYSVLFWDDFVHISRSLKRVQLGDEWRAMGNDYE